MNEQKTRMKMGYSEKVLADLKPYRNDKPEKEVNKYMCYERTQFISFSNKLGVHFNK